MNFLSGSGDNFLIIMNSLYLVPLITKPTRVTSSTATLIDNIFTNVPNVISGVITSDLSDHFPVFAVQKCAISGLTGGGSINISRRIIHSANIIDVL